MKFGIFYELQLPRPWEPGGELRLYQNALDQVELADRLGYDYAWEVEHHFLEEYSHSPAPEVFLGAASQRTKNIRLGHGIVQLTTNPPGARRRAHRRARPGVDGRVEFGIGEGASITELEPLRPRLGEKREVWEDAVRAIIPMFRDGGCEYHGTYFDFPMRNVLPKPVQKPHPPLWVRLLAARDDRDGRAPRHGRAGLPVPVAPRRRTPGCTPITTPSSSARRSSPTTRPIRTSRWSAISCAPRPTRRRAAAPTASRSSSSRCAFTGRARPQAAGARHGQHVGRIQQVEARRTPRRAARAVGRADRLARDDCGASCGGSRPRTSTR